MTVNDKVGDMSPSVVCMTMFQTETQCRQGRGLLCLSYTLPVVLALLEVLYVHSRNVTGHTAIRTSRYCHTHLSRVW